MRTVDIGHIQICVAAILAEEIAESSAVPTQYANAKRLCEVDVWTLTWPVVVDYNI